MCRFDLKGRREGQSTRLHLLKTCYLPPIFVSMELLNGNSWRVSFRCKKDDVTVRTLVTPLYLGPLPSLDTGT